MSYGMTTSDNPFNDVGNTREKLLRRDLTPAVHTIRRSAGAKEETIVSHLISSDSEWTHAQRKSTNKDGTVFNFGRLR